MGNEDRSQRRGIAVAHGAAMSHTSLRDFMKIGHQVRWLSWLALWLIASYSLRLWIDD